MRRRAASRARCSLREGRTKTSGVPCASGPGLSGRSTRCLSGLPSASGGVALWCARHSALQLASRRGVDGGGAESGGRGSTAGASLGAAAGSAS